MPRLIAVICSLLLLAGCNTPAPHVDVYDGLLPAGFKLADSPERPVAATLRDKTAVLVTSTNFNNYTTEWQNYYEKGGEEKDKGMQGLASALSSLFGAVSQSAARDAVDIGGDKVRKASDPRAFVDRMYSTLRPYFKSVRPAVDFAEAKEMKADYIFLLDFHATWNQMGDVYLTRGGAYMLDATLRRVLVSEGKAEVDREGGGLFSGVGVVEGTANTLSKGLDRTVAQILEGVRTKLGPPPR